MVMSDIMMKKGIWIINLPMIIALKVRVTNSCMFGNKWPTFIFIGITVVTVIAFWTFSAMVYFGMDEDSVSETPTDIEGPVGLVKIHGWIQLVGDPTNYELSSSDVVAEIDAFNNDPDIEMIVLEIHSSGGSTSGADEIIAAIKKVGKPVVAMVREQAVSSAYLVASAADTIYADRYAMVGGMGITGSFLSNAGKNRQEGAEFVEISSGPHKDMWNRDREMTAEERAIEQSIVDQNYETYIQTVAEGRKLDIETIRKLADGRPYSTQQALELKLIDKIGGIEEIYSQELGW